MDSYTHILCSPTPGADYFHSSHWAREDWLARLPIHQLDASWDVGRQVIDDHQREIEVTPRERDNHGLIGELVRHAIRELGDEIMTEDVYALLRDGGYDRAAIMVRARLELLRLGYASERPPHSKALIWRKR